MNLQKKLFEIQNLRLKYEKDATNPFFKSKYITLESLWKTLSPELEKRKLLVSHYTKDKEVTTQVIDIEDDKSTPIESSIPLPEDLSPQKLGSAITYHKRYNLGQLFNIMIDDDDDGNGATPKKEEETSQEKTEPTSKDLAF